MDSIFLDGLMDQFTAVPEGTMNDALSQMRDTPKEREEPFPCASTAVALSNGDTSNLLEFWTRAVTFGEKNVVSNALNLTTLYIESSVRDGLTTREDADSFLATLQPLLNHLCSSCTVSPCLAEAFLILLPGVVDFILLAYGVERGNYWWALRHYDEIPSLRALLQPFSLSATVLYEKELFFHFSVKSETSKFNEPQHFFSFLSLKLRQLRGLDHPSWYAGSADTQSVWNSTSLASLRLLSVAHSVFRDHYQWTPTSPFLRDSTRVCHVINSVLDFFVAHENANRDESIFLFVNQLLFPESVAVYFQHSCRCVSLSLRNGGERFWRRPFLQKLPYRHLYYCTAHFTRSLDAILRTISGLQPLKNPITSEVWGCVTVPSVAEFVLWLTKSEVDFLENESDVYSVALAAHVMLHCVEVVQATLEKWCGVFSNSSLDYFPTLFELQSRCAEYSKRSVHLGIEELVDIKSGGVNVPQFIRLEMLLENLHCLPEGASSIQTGVLEEFTSHSVLSTLHETLSDLTHHFNLKHVQKLVSSIEKV